MFVLQFICIIIHLNFIPLPNQVMISKSMLENTTNFNEFNRVKSNKLIKNQFIQPIHKQNKERNKQASHFRF